MRPRMGAMTGSDAQPVTEVNFTTTDFTVGVEEELMIIDSETMELAGKVESLLAETEPEEIERVKPELLESVLEISTSPCHTVAEAAEELRDLRRQQAAVAGRSGCVLGSAGTHPFSHWEEQSVVKRDRYLWILDALQIVVRRLLVFGMHIHVGLDSAEKAVHVNNGMRLHLPVLLALSANSPLWRGFPTGLHSYRTRIWRTVPRTGLPPYYCDFADWEERCRGLIQADVIEDYTFMWWDVRLHPRWGTVEVRVMDSQSELLHTAALVAMVQSTVKELAEGYERGETIPRYSYELLDENKWRAARYGLEGRLIDVPAVRQVDAVTYARRRKDELMPHARELGCDRELEDGIEDMLRNGNGAQRQLCDYGSDRDLRRVLEGIVRATNGG